MKKSANNKNLFKKIVSFVFALLIATLSLPFAFAAESIALTESNVLEWPTVLYKNENGEYVADGSMYYGQKIMDYLALSGGVVTTDGTKDGEIIEGIFEFDFPETLQYPTDISEAHSACIKFVPKDTTTYTGFSLSLTQKVTFKVSAVTLALVDESDVPRVEEAVEYNTQLRNVTITGGKMQNPYNAEDPEVLAGYWKWSNIRTKVTKSGYYPAKFLAGGHQAIETEIYVRLAGEAAETEISEFPTIEDYTYDSALMLKDVALKGGKAVIKGSTTEVSGTFALAEKYNNKVLTVGTHELDATFTPEDSTIALPCDFKVSVTVNKAVPTFKTDDESGIPTITMPYGTKLDSSLDYKIKGLIDVDSPVYLSYKDMNGEDLSYSGTTPLVGTHEIQVKVNVQDSNYEQYTMLTFKLEITGFTANCIMEPVGSQGYKIHDTSLKYDASKPTGTFTVSYTVDGEKQPDITVKYGDLFQVEKSKSGKYEFSVKYNEIENDPFEIADITYSTEEKLERNVKIGDSIKKYIYGDKVTAVAPATDPSMPDKPYYGFAGWEVTGNIGLSDEELANTEISFAMPDEDVEINATYEFSLKLFFEWIWQQIVQFFTFIINACKDLFALAAA